MLCCRLRLADPARPTGRTRASARPGDHGSRGEDMTLALVCGAGVGAGLWAVARGIAPPRPSLAQALGSLRRRDQVWVAPGGFDAGGVAARVGRPLVKA